MGDSLGSPSSRAFAKRHGVMPWIHLPPHPFPLPYHGISTHRTLHQVSIICDERATQIFTLLHPVVLVPLPWQHRDFSFFPKGDENTIQRWPRCGHTIYINHGICTPFQHRRCIDVRRFLLYDHGFVAILCLYSRAGRTRPCGRSEASGHHRTPLPPNRILHSVHPLCERRILPPIHDNRLELRWCVALHPLYRPL